MRPTGEGHHHRAKPRRAAQDLGRGGHVGRFVRECRYGQCPLVGVGTDGTVRRSGQCEAGVRDRAAHRRERCAAELRRPSGHQQERGRAGRCGVLQRGAGQWISGPATASGPTSGPVTVHTDAATPWDPSVYNQSMPDNGYGYLTTRDGTKLATRCTPPTHPAAISECHLTLPPGILPGYAQPWPDAHRIFRVRLRQSGRSAERHRHPGQPDGLRRGRRQHARAPAAPAVRTTSSSLCRTSTATTSSRPSPDSRGSRTTRSA